jgi:hypothetical protein
MKYLIPEIGADNFDWSSWRRGDEIFRLLNFRPSWYSVLDNIEILRSCARGYTSGYKLMCRPDPEEMAVMFSINSVDGWFHLRKKEFERIFNVG